MRRSIRLRRLTLHPLLALAARGRIPGWARAGPARRRHMERVAGLLGEWATALDLGRMETERWRAAGWLHDVLREADPAELRPIVPAALSDLPGRVLHGPAAAVRLRAEGVDDEPFLLAVAFHTIGHPEFDTLGRAVYAADFLEPGRRGVMEWRGALRARMPAEPAAVVREVARSRIGGLLEAGAPLPRETCEFWNKLTRDG